MGPSCQGRESGQHVGAHSQIAGVVAQNVDDTAQVGGENARFVNGKFTFMISKVLTVWLFTTPILISTRAGLADQ